MPRYAALLRGISPMNATMAGLRRAFEAAGFADVRTVISSGNVVFSTPRPSGHRTLERRAEAALADTLDRSFLTIVRAIDDLAALLAADPFARYRLGPQHKRVVTFLRDRPAARLRLPRELDGARILAVRDREILTAYLPSPRGAAFMTLIEKTFGTAVTTRTWETVGRIVRAGSTPQQGKGKAERKDQ